MQELVCHDCDHRTLHFSQQDVKYRYEKKMEQITSLLDGGVGEKEQDFN